MNMRPILFAGLLLICNATFGQRMVTVQHGVTASNYSTLDSALLFSQNGDQIYLPGGIFNQSNYVINKSVMIFGSGHYQDSSLATGQTYITGNILLVSGASGGLITGCNINGDILVGDGTTGSDSVSNYSISRCSFLNLKFSYTGTAPTNARTFSISENVIHGKISGANAANVSFEKNVIEGFVSVMNGGFSFKNNNFIGFGNCTTMLNQLVDVSSCLFENNIILFKQPACTTASFFSPTCNNNIFANNLFSDTITFPSGTNTGSSNITNQPVVSIFNNATGNVFSYSSDYHLKISSPGIHAGSDGYDIGIYGTQQPYKTAAIPFNPHIQISTANSITNPQGQLNIQVRVAAQSY